MTNDPHDLDALAERLRAGDTSVIAELVRRGAREQLRRGLESEHDAVREEALSGLARVGDLRDLPIMLELMDDIYVDDVAQLCVPDYGAAAVEPLIEKLRTGADERPLGVIEALGEIGDERAVAPLREAATSHRDETVRQWAQEALEKIAARS
jgi:HEAT repeat protein